jgi:hypothetical protein
MGNNERLRREDPVRASPIRKFAGVFQSNGFDNPSAQSEGVSQEPAASHDSGVRLAYRVIEKHINEGRRAAESFNSHPYPNSSRTVNDGFQELLERLLRFQSEFLPQLLEVLGSAVKIDPARPLGAPGFSQPPQGNGANSPASHALSIEVTSARPAQITIDLREGSEALPLTSPGLHALEVGKPPLNEIGFVPDVATGTIKIVVTIPNNQPGGTYSGVVVNRKTGEARGTLSVRLADG